MTSHLATTQGGYWLFAAAVVLVNAFLFGRIAFGLAQRHLVSEGRTAGLRRARQELAAHVPQRVSSDALLRTSRLSAPGLLVLIVGVTRSNQAAGRVFDWWWSLFTRHVAGQQFGVRVESSLRVSGLLPHLTISSVERACSMCSLIGGSVTALIAVSSRLSFPEITVLFVAGAVLGSRIPLVLAESIARRRSSLLRAEVIPWLDMLALTAAVGLSFDRAVEEYTARFTGELSLLLGEARARWATGAVSRDAALTHVADIVGSPAYSRITASLIQSISLGSPLSVSAESYAQDMRESRRNELEASIGKAPVKMLLPMAGLILPALLILLFTPILSQVFGGLRGGW